MICQDVEWSCSIGFECAEILRFRHCRPIEHRHATHAPKVRPLRIVPPVVAGKLASFAHFFHQSAKPPTIKQIGSPLLPESSVRRIAKDSESAHSPYRYNATESVLKTFKHRKHQESLLVYFGFPAQLVVLRRASQRTGRSQMRPNGRVSGGHRRPTPVFRFLTPFFLPPFLSPDVGPAIEALREAIGMLESEIPERQNEAA